MYHYNNPHPKGLCVNDRVKRAIVHATGLDYIEVQHQLNHYKKVTGCKDFNDRDNCNKYVENVLHGKKMSFPAVKGRPRMNGSWFAERFPKGHYILNMAGHWSSCIDGEIWDTWDCSDKCVYIAYEIPTDIQHKK